MRIALAENSVVVNIIEADKDYKDYRGREVVVEDVGIGLMRTEGKWGDPSTQEFVDGGWQDKPAPDRIAREGLTTEEIEAAKEEVLHDLAVERAIQEKQREREASLEPNEGGELKG